MPAENGKIFVDSNYFVALFNPNDTLRKQASVIAKRIDTEQRRLVLSNYILLEVTTVLSQRRGRNVAVEVGTLLTTNPMIDVVHVDEILHKESWEIFQNMPRKNMSFVDCSTLAILHAEHIDRLLSFDVADFRGLQKQHRFKLFTMS